MPFVEVIELQFCCVFRKKVAQILQFFFSNFESLGRLLSTELLRMLLLCSQLALSAFYRYVCVFSMQVKLSVVFFGIDILMIFIP